MDAGGEKFSDAAAAEGGEGGGDLYAVLGLKKECSDADLKVAYRKLAKKWHPDKCSSSSSVKHMEEAKEKFQEIQGAYSVLSDANKRLLYDVGVYDDEDDEDSMQGMGDFIGEMAQMMSQVRPTGINIAWDGTGFPRPCASPGACKGHLVRKFIKECWSKCGCGMQCGNRVIQRGITCKLQVFFTREGKGWGVRTVEDLPKGAFVCEYVGEILTSAELHERAIENARNGKHMHQVLLDAGWGSGVSRDDEGSGVLRDEEALSLDGSFYGNVGRFINHRCYDPNLVQIPVEIETPDHHYYHLAFFTNKKVEAFEELTWDYGIDFDDVEGPSKPFRCMCGSRYCRDPNNTRRMGRAASKRK